MNKLQIQNSSGGGSLDSRLRETMAVVQEQDARSEAQEQRQRQHSGTERGRRRLFEHRRDQGEQVETLWESGKTIRHLTQEEGKDT